jgi:hypothetical protein
MVIKLLTSFDWLWVAGNGNFVGYKAERPSIQSTLDIRPLLMQLLLLHTFKVVKYKSKTIKTKTTIL